MALVFVGNDIFSVDVRDLVCPGQDQVMDEKISRYFVFVFGMYSFIVIQNKCKIILLHSTNKKKKHIQQKKDHNTTV